MSDRQGFAWRGVTSFQVLPLKTLLLLPALVLVPAPVSSGPCDDLYADLSKAMGEEFEALTACFGADAASGRIAGFACSGPPEASRPLVELDIVRLWGWDDQTLGASTRGQLIVTQTTSVVVMCQVGGATPLVVRDPATIDAILAAAK